MKVVVKIEPGEDGWFVVTVPALPGCISQGKTIEEAKENIKEAIELFLAPEEEGLKEKMEISSGNLIVVDV